ncbi:MAG: oligosaccharide flippase family protein [Lachnospiraceae bacterium]|nr:oligosaccharide flippase family protein [Lachnospiraceae bacterium]
MYSGVFFHLISKIVFVGSSYAIHFFLGRFLPEEVYGTVGTIITIMNFEYIFFTDGVRQGMAKAIASGKYEEKSVLRRGFVFQMFLMAFFFLITFFGAGMIASALGDETLSPYIRRIAYLLPFTGIYSLMLGILNGHQKFLKEAVAGLIYPILKLSIIPFVAFVFADPVLGTENGFLFAVVSIALISGIMAYTASGHGGSGGECISYREYGASTCGYLLLFGASCIMMNADTLILKRFAANAADVGYYTGVVNFAKIPYYLLTAIYTVALPVITELYARGALKEARDRIGKLLSLAIAFVFPGVLVIAAASQHVLSLFYKPQYAAGGTALTYLVIGITCLGMTLIFSMILSAADARRTMIVSSVLMVVSELILCPILTIRCSLTGTALATLLSTAVGMLLTGVFTYRVFGRFLTGIHVASLIMICICFAGEFALFQIYAPQNFIILAALCAGLYLLQAAVLATLLKTLPTSIKMRHTT